MEKTVSNGYRDCTVLLDGTECRVKFDHCYPAFAVMNDSTEYVFVSIEQGKQSGEDGVRRIAPGCSSVIAHMRTNVDTVYVTGLGSVQISAQNGTENPFKSQSGGGDTTINGNVVTPSAVNGNIRVDGIEIEVYDDTDIKEQLAGIGSGVSPTVVENENNTDELYKLDITDVNGTFTTPNLIGKAGAQGIQGAKGEKGDTGEQGLQGVQGIKGDKGDDGYPFLIYREYNSIDEFDSAHFPEIGLMFMVKTGENFPVYRYTGDTDIPYSYITELATSEGIKGEKGDKGDTGEQGIQGEAGKDGADGTTYIPSIGTVESAETASVSVEIDEETKQAVFNFGLPKGADGEKAVQFTPVITEDNELAWENDGGLENPPTVPIQQILSNAPIGTVISYAGSAAPKGYLVCDGQSVAVADYPDLYAVIGNTYGGDSTNFNVPDYREVVLVGVGENTTDTIANHDVYELGEFKDDQMQSHTHTLTIPDVYYQYTPTANGGPGARSTRTGTTSNNSGRSGTTTHGKQKGVTYIIKAKYEGVEIEANGITVDSVLNNTSTNPVQNKAIVEALANKANLSDIPTELPADGGTADMLIINKNKKREYIAGTSYYYYETSDLETYEIPHKYVFVERMVFGNDPHRRVAELAYKWSSTQRIIWHRTLHGSEWSDWVEIYNSQTTTQSVTGTASISYNSENGGVHELEVLDFTPSFVICKHTERYNSNGDLIPAEPITNGFKITVSDTTVTSVDYIAFK